MCFRVAVCLRLCVAGGHERPGASLDVSDVFRRHFPCSALLPHPLESRQRLAGIWRRRQPQKPHDHESEGHAKSHFHVRPVALHTPCPCDGGEQTPNDESRALRWMVFRGLAKSALGKAEPSFKLSLLGFDACLMASLDTLEAFADLTHFFIASQENEPGHGWNYR